MEGQKEKMGNDDSFNWIPPLFHKSSSSAWKNFFCVGSLGGDMAKGILTLEITSNLFAATIITSSTSY